MNRMPIFHRQQVEFKGHIIYYIDLNIYIYIYKT